MWSCPCAVVVGTALPRVVTGSAVNEARCFLPHEIEGKVFDSDHSACRQSTSEVSFAAMKPDREPIRHASSAPSIMDVRIRLDAEYTKRAAGLGPSGRPEDMKESGEDQTMHYTLRTLPLAQRVLFTCYADDRPRLPGGHTLSLLVDVKPHATAGEGSFGIADECHGVQRVWRLPWGPMADRASPEDKEKVFKWVRDGAKEDTFATEAARH